MGLNNWIIAIVAGLAGLFCAAANWFGLIRWIAKKINYSQIMFIGGILLCVCIYNTPLCKLWFIGLLVDPGVWIGLYSLPPLLKQMFK